MGAKSGTTGTELSLGKWHEKLDAADLSELTALARDINKAVDQTVKQVARGKIRVGKLLCEARAVFSEDQAFGMWRKENTLVASKQHAHYLMQVAKRFGDVPKLIDGVNYSVMQELVLADQKDIKWIEEKLDAGEDIPTVAEVRHKVKQTQAERLAPRELKGTSKKGQPHTGTIIPSSPNAHINTIVPMGLAMRIKMVVERGIKGIEGDLIILGMDPDPQCPCHELVLDAIAELWEQSTDNPDHKRAIEDSYGRVVADFKNWDH